MPLITTTGGGSARGLGRGRGEGSAPVGPMASGVYRSTQLFYLLPDSLGSGVGPDGSTRTRIADSLGGTWFLYANYGTAVSRWGGAAALGVNHEAATNSVTFYNFSSNFKGFGENYSSITFSQSNAYSFFTDAVSEGIIAIANWTRVGGALDSTFGTSDRLNSSPAFSMYCIRPPNNSTELLLGFGNAIGSDAAVALVNKGDNEKVASSTAFHFKDLTVDPVGDGLQQTGLYNIIYNLTELGNPDAGLVVAENQTTAPYVFYFLAR